AKAQRQRLGGNGCLQLYLQPLGDRPQPQRHGETDRRDNPAHDNDDVANTPQALAACERCCRVFARFLPVVLGLDFPVQPDTHALARLYYACLCLLMIACPAPRLKLVGWSPQRARMKVQWGMAGAGFRPTPTTPFDDGSRDDHRQRGPVGADTYAYGLCHIHRQPEAQQRHARAGIDLPPLIAVHLAAVAVIRAAAHAASARPADVLASVVGAVGVGPVQAARPLPDVAAHIEHALRRLVFGEDAHRRRLADARLAGVHVVVAGPVAKRVFAPLQPGGGALPFRLGEQPVRLLCLCPQPVDVGDGLVPGDAHHGPAGDAKARVAQIAAKMPRLIAPDTPRARPVLVAFVLAGVPELGKLRVRYRVAGNGERLERHGMLLLALAQPEAPTLDDHHLRLARADTGAWVAENAQRVAGLHPLDGAQVPALHQRDKLLHQHGDKLAAQMIVALGVCAPVDREHFCRPPHGPPTLRTGRVRAFDQRVDGCQRTASLMLVEYQVPDGKQQHLMPDIALAYQVGNAVDEVQFVDDVDRRQEL